MTTASKVTYALYYLPIKLPIQNELIFTLGDFTYALQAESTGILLLIPT